MRTRPTWSPDEDTRALASTRAAAVLAVLIGTAVFGAGLVGPGFLGTLGAGPIAAGPDVGLAIAAAGTSLLLVGSGRPWARSALAVLAAAFGGAALAERVLGMRLHLDAVVAPARGGGGAGAIAPAWMGAPTSVHLLLVGLALLLADVRRRGARSAAQLVAFSAVPLPLLAFIAWLYGVPAPYAAAIALPAALGLLAIDVGILLRPHGGLVANLGGSGAGAALSRRMLIYAVAVPAALGSVVASGYRAGAYGGELALAVLVVALAGSFAALVLRDAVAIGRIDLANRRALAERERSREALARALAGERDARAAAETASRAKDEFLGLLSHELRTPLNAIIGWSRMLRESPGGAAQVARGLAVVERNGRALAQVVSDLLDFARLASGKLVLDESSVDLARAVAAAVDGATPAADAKRIRVTRSLGAGVRIRGDPARLEQVAWNLLSNAVKFTPVGGHVEVRLFESDGRAVLEVADDGVGLASEFLPRLFERFSQADASSSRRHGGLGLGLALCRHLVELHRGAISAQSRGAGRGATFRVTLPVDGATEAQPDAAAARRARLAGRRILVVEDEPDSRELLLQLLASWGARPTGAASAREALDFAAAERPDVVLSDIAMPGEDGFAFLDALRRAEAARGEPPVPVAALTAFARPEDRARVLAAGFDAHVPKPLEPDALLDVIGALLARGSVFDIAPHACSPPFAASDRSPFDRLRTSGTRDPDPAGAPPPARTAGVRR